LTVGWVFFYTVKGICQRQQEITQNQRNAQGYAAQTLLAALGSVQFVTNVVFARFVLHETVTYYTLAGTLMILAGNAYVYMLNISLAVGVLISFAITVPCPSTCQ
jgi:drug/metabolite transporter superfamily protein YnfA